jgi:hypothetical protein
LTANYISPVKTSREKDMIGVRLAAAASARACGLYPCIRHRLPVGALCRWEFEKVGKSIEIAVQGPLILNDDRLIVDAAAT